MIKLALMALVCGSLTMAQQQLTVQLAPQGGSTLNPLKIVRRGGPQAATDQSGAPVSPVTAPTSGYVTNPSGGVRPILGFGPFSVIGDTLDFGEDIAAMVPSPNQNYLVEIASSGMASLWVDVSGGLGQVAFPSDVSQTSSVTPSPLGFSVAVISRSRGVVQVFSSLPTAPALAFSASFSELGGAPASLAVSDDGSTLLYTISEGKRESLRTVQNGGAPQFVDGGSFGSLAFAPNSLDAAATDVATNRVYLLHYGNGQYALLLLGDEGAGVSRPEAVQFSRDGQQVVVANSGSKTIQTLRVDGSGGSTTACGCAPSTLARLIGNAVFQITPFDGSTAVIFDGDLQPGVVVTAGVLPTTGPQ
jgi:hypothetical protein